MLSLWRHGESHFKQVLGKTLTCKRRKRERGERIKSLVFVPGCVYIEAIMFAKVIELLLLQDGVLC